MSQPDPLTDASPSASVIIPAHNEAGVLGRCLEALLRCPLPLEILVAANGCTDATAAVARAYPGVRVIELAEASKTAALNAADAAATAFPRIYLDADIELGPTTVTLLVEALDSPEPTLAHPVVHFATAGCAPLVRAYYAVAEQLDLPSQSGVYAVNRAGRARFPVFPDVQGDDLFVRRHFTKDEIAICGRSVVRPPRTLANLVKVRTRVARGNRELARGGHPAPAAGDTELTADFTPSTRGTLDALGALVRDRPGQFPAVLVYVVVTLLARVRSRANRTAAWPRDTSTRPPRAAGDRVAARPRIAYLNSLYPALSHTFIEREVLTLRELGYGIDTFSVRPCPPEDLRSSVMEAEYRNTRVLLADRKWHLILAHAALVLRRPGVWLRALRIALRTGYPTPKARLWQVFYFVEAVALHRWMQRSGLRHVHVHHANPAADVARLACRIGCLADGPGTWTWSLTVHGSAEFEFAEQWDVSAKLREAIGVACISDFCRGQLLRLVETEHWDKIRVVHMSVDADHYRAPASRQHDGPLRILCVGRLVPLKGLPILITALERLAASGVRTSTRIIGQGPMMDPLRRAVDAAGLTEAVQFVGPVGQDDILAHYHWADVFVHPSFLEGLPVVLMEAMATELPVIATQVGAIAELVQDQSMGRVLPMARPDLLAAALEHLAADPSLRQAMGRAGRRAVLAEFTPVTCGPVMDQFLLDTLKGAGQGLP